MAFSLSFKVYLSGPDSRCLAGAVGKRFCVQGVEITLVTWNRKRNPGPSRGLGHVVTRVLTAHPALTKELFYRTNIHIYQKKIHYLLHAHICRK